MTEETKQELKQPGIGQQLEFTGRLFDYKEFREYSNIFIGNDNGADEIKAELNIILSKYNKHVICIYDVSGLADGHAREYMDLILSYNPEYKFRFYEEQDAKGQRYKDNILVALP